MTASTDPPIASAAVGTLPLPTRLLHHTFYYGWYIVLVSFVASMMSTGLQAYTLGVFLKPMTADLGWSRTDLSFGQTVSTAASAVLAFWVGPLLDRHGGRTLMVIGAIAMGAGFAAIGQVHELWQYYLVKGVLVTAGSTCAGALVVNVALSNWFIRRRGIAIAIGAMGVSVAALVVPLISTQLIEAYGWRTAWALIGVTIPIVIVPLAILIMRRRPEDYGLEPDGGGSARPVARARAASMALQGIRWTRRQALRSRSLWMLTATFSLASVGLSALLLHLIPWLSDRGLSGGQAASAFGMVGLAGLISKPLWGIALDRFNTSHCAAAEFLLMATGLATMMLVDGLVLLHLAVFILGIGIGGVTTVQEVVWAEYFGRATIGMIRGLVRPFTVIASAGGPVFAAVAYDVRGSYEVAFIAFLVTYVLAAGLILVTPYPTPPTEAGTTAA
ncbi:MAG: hypothetical protein CVU47_02515 [Chloroflexi bacterium HGW-Chloroflexi-9]|nr:MAG: hypothetical protein CVU47_02515 [Chloroflexi bacterium HGW-Chloroflexi-9]